MRKLMILTTMLLLLASTVVTAQRGHGPRGEQKAPFAELDLNEEQKEKIKAIQAESRTKMMAMRTESDRGSVDRAAMAKLREEARKDMEAVLTPAQLQKLEELKAERREAIKNVDKKALKADLREAREEAMKVVSAARYQLDAFISEEDKVAIERLRGVFETKPRFRKEGRKEKPTAEEKEATRAEAQRWKEDHQADIDEAKALVEKYREDIERIHEKLAPQMEKWAEQKREIVHAYLPAEAKPNEEGRHKGKKRQEEGAAKRPRGAKAVAFLLMRP